MKCKIKFSQDGRYIDMREEHGIFIKTIACKSCVKRLKKVIKKFEEAKK